jgi:hypothetical protein
MDGIPISMPRAQSPSGQDSAANKPVIISPAISTIPAGMVMNIYQGRAPNAQLLSLQLGIKEAPIIPSTNGANPIDGAIKRITLATFFAFLLVPNSSDPLSNISSRMG